MAVTRLVMSTGSETLNFEPVGKPVTVFLGVLW